jgi:hypothetical protein
MDQLGNCRPRSYFLNFLIVTYLPVVRSKQVIAMHEELAARGGHTLFSRNS